MNILDRFVLSIYTFCLAVISLFVMLVTLNLVSYGNVSLYLDMILKNGYYSKLALLISLVFFLVSIRFLLSGISKSKRKRPIETASELGSIVITLESIQNIINSELKQIQGIMESKIDLENRKGAVAIKLKLVVTPEKNIPDFSATIQSRTKDIVQKIAGVEVAFVEVTVLDVAQVVKPITKNKLA